MAASNDSASPSVCLKPFFNTDGIAALRDSAYKPDGSAIRQFFIGIDTPAGSPNSEYTIVSAFYTPCDQMVLCGAEVDVCAETKDFNAVLTSHVAANREQVPVGKNSHIVLVPDSNLAMEALCLPSGNWCVMREDVNRVGIRLTKSSNVLMATALGFKITRRNIFMALPFISVSDDERSGADMRDLLVEQLRQCWKPVDPKYGDTSGGEVSYSGTHGPSDSLSTTAQLINLLQPRFWTDEDAYGRWH